jgi:cellobiose phosphorylase
MWIEEKGVVTPFQPDGALRLIDHVQDEKVFRHCQRALDLEPEQFGTNGIDTLGDLNDHLDPCGS